MPEELKIRIEEQHKLLDEYALVRRTLMVDETALANLKIELEKAERVFFYENRERTASPDPVSGKVNVTWSGKLMETLMDRDDTISTIRRAVDTKIQEVARSKSELDVLTKVMSMEQSHNHLIAAWLGAQ